MARTSDIDQEDLLAGISDHELASYLGAAAGPQLDGTGSRVMFGLPSKISLLTGCLLMVVGVVTLVVGMRSSAASAAVGFGPGAVVGLSERHKCSSATENCMETKCCKDPGFTCYKKNDHWANCNDTCTKGSNHLDPEEHRTPWSCDVLGGDACSGATENCMDTKCCKDPGFTCYEKNAHWANCNDTCARGANHLDPEEHRTPWTCKVVGPTAGYPGNPDPERCTRHHSTYPTRIGCLADPDARGPYPPAKKLWSCECDKGCDAPREELCEQCGSRGGKTCYWALTWYCCDDADYRYRW